MDACAISDTMNIGMGVNAVPALPRGEAEALLALFSFSETRDRAVPTTMISPPNGERLYIAPYHSAWANG